MFLSFLEIYSNQDSSWWFYCSNGDACVGMAAHAMKITGLTEQRASGIRNVLTTAWHTKECNSPSWVSWAPITCVTLEWAQRVKPASVHLQSCYPNFRGDKFTVSITGHTFSWKSLDSIFYSLSLLISMSNL